MKHNIMGYTIDYIKKRTFEDNKNNIIAVVGSTGSGKSWSALKLSEDLDSTFNIDRVIFVDIDKFLELTETLERGQVIVFDEAGIAASSSEWQNRYNRVINYMLQVFRKKGLTVFFCVPRLTFIAKKNREMMHAVFKTMYIDKKNCKVVIKPKWTEEDSEGVKTYRKYLRVRTEEGTIKINKIEIGLPNKKLRDEYEKKKSEFITKLTRELREGKKKEQTKYPQKNCPHCNHIWIPKIETPKYCPECGKNIWEAPKIKIKTTQM